MRWLRPILLASVLLAARAAAVAESLVITGALIADGSGGPLRRSEVRIEGNRIAEVGRIRPRPGEKVLRADGLVLAPGFIDIHNHSTSDFEAEPLAASQVSQGITTLAVGADGSSPWPIADYRRQRSDAPAAVNLLVLVGHATVRREVMDWDYRRAATPEEVRRMAQLVEQGMREGAVGLSSGLEYEVGSYSATEELVELSRAAGKHGGFYMTHIRDEADKSLEAFAEAVAIGERARIPVQISHIKLGTVGVWGQTEQVRSLIEGARAGGVDVTADAYPYTAWHSNLEVLVPNKRYDDPASVAEALADVGGARNITISHCEAHPEYEKRNMEEIAASLGITPVELYIRTVKEGGAYIIGHSMNDPDVEFFLGRPWVMIGSDGGIGSSHPRGAGAFPRVLGRYVREKKLFSLPAAIRKMTSMPAARLKLPDRGSVRAGMKADLVLLDPKTVADRSTFEQPGLLSEGIRLVLVNGETVWEDARPTGARPGRVLGPGGEALPEGPNAASHRVASRADALFHEYDRPDSPGCALAVVRGGKTVHARGYGMASLEHGVPITPKTVFDIGSTAKQFAAASVVLLAQRGKLSLEDDVRRSIPELPDYGRTVTIRHLLQHTSGLTDYIGLLYLSGRRTEDLSTDEEALSALSRVPRLEFEPGSKHAYSNSGYFLLSVIVRRASGQDLKDFARENIFEPLSMTSTQYVKDHGQIVARRATGYAAAPGGGFRLEASDWEQNGDGGLQTTVEDLARWDANFDHPAVGGEDLIRQLTTPGKVASGEPLEYGLGLRIDEYRGTRRISHGGSWAGFRAMMARYPEHRLSVFTLCNLGTARPAELARRVADIYLAERLGPAPPEAAPAASRKLVRLMPGELSRWAGVYWSPETDSVREILVREKRLIYRRVGGSESELEPAAPGRFRVKEPAARVEVAFSPRPEGGAEMRVIPEAGAPTLYERMPPARTSPAERATFAGHFWSDELRARYAILWDGTDFSLERNGYAKSRLEPIFSDAFYDKEVGVIRVLRDASGSVRGFTVRSGGVSLAFRRQT